MNIQNLKNDVRAAFEGVESKDFLQSRIEFCLESQRRDFQDYMKENPGSNFGEWKERVEKSVNQHAKESFMEIGVFLLALDEFNEDLN